MRAEQRQWTLDMIEAVRPTAAKIGISPEAIVAQAAVESAWGRSAIGKNMFGIKADASWHGKTQVVRTREVDANGREYYIDAAFRDYDTFAESVADHFSFLDRNSRYRAAGVFDGKGDEHYFRALQAAGYATDPHYADVLLSVLNTIKSVVGSVDATAGPRDLRLGDSGDDVRRLQKALNAKFDAMLDEDSQFGSVTMLATRHWQKANGLVVDGVVGPATRASLGL